MPKTLIESVVTELQQERARLENELHRVSAALTAFGKVFLPREQAPPVAIRKENERFQLRDAVDLQPRREPAGQRSGQRKKK